MESFFIFYAPVLFVLISLFFAFWVSLKDGPIE